MKAGLGLCGAFLCSFFAIPLQGASTQRPNVIFFAVDDMSDWISPMGYDQAITPHMDRLAQMGVVYQNAHTAGVYCAPSRAAVFTGRLAFTTGNYRNSTYFVNRPDITPLQVAFRTAGYLTYGAGKLFHHGAGCIDMRGWSVFYHDRPEDKHKGWPQNPWSLDHPALPNPYPASIFNHDRKPENKFFLEWGAIPNEKEEIMGDTMRVNWATEIIKKKHDEPFFVGIGLYTPHFPNYAPQKYFDMYDPEKIKHPPYNTRDLEDLPPAIKKEKTARAVHHHRLEKLDAIEKAIHGYLACVTYADAMLGRVLDALESGPNADNTIIVFWSDHGYHHGEKFDWGKHTLWERTSNVPFIWAGPGIAQGKSIHATASLIDMFPTLLDLCGIPQEEGLEGASLASDLKNPENARDRTVILPGMKPNEYAVMNQQWRYIHYADGTEELYNVARDPHEWTNLAGKPEYAPLQEKLKAQAPKKFARPAGRAKKVLIIEGETFRWEKP